jgi:hypothetical protein
VFRAQAKGRSLQFDTAGVIGGNEVFRDRQTGSRWQQSTLEAISGPLKGEHLELFPFLLTSWGEWHRVHPETLVLKPLPGYADRLRAKNAEIQEGLSGKGSAPAGVLRNDSRLPPKAMILGLEVDGISKAFPLSALRSVRVVNEEFGKRPVVIVHQSGSDTTTAFSASIKGQTLRFEAADAQASAIIDAQTHSRWDPYGLCISGKLRGSQLESLIVEPEYWFAWSEFHPKTGIFSASQGATAR